MAELIPTHYRVRLVVRQRVRRWISAGFVIVAICGAAVTAAAVWAHASAAEVARLQAQYRSQATLIEMSKSVQDRAAQLADRMKRIEGLRDDKTLLALLRNVSAGFSELDCLEYLHVDARGPAPKTSDAAAAADAATDSDSSRFIVRMSGITSTTGTLADLMTRMGKTSDPRMQVQLESSKREAYLNGQVIRFQLSCEKPKDKT
jgi:hypothetical protein